MKFTLLLTICCLCLTSISGYSQLVVKNNQEIEIMRVTNEGNLGVGVSNPTHNLHVLGNGRFEALAGNGEAWVKVDNNGVLFTQQFLPGQLAGKCWVTTNLSIPAYSPNILLPFSGGDCPDGTYVVPEDGNYEVSAQMTRVYPNHYGSSGK